MKVKCIKDTIGFKKGEEHEVVNTSNEKKFWKIYYKDDWAERFLYYLLYPEYFQEVEERRFYVWDWVEIVDDRDIDWETNYSGMKKWERFCVEELFKCDSWWYFLIPRKWVTCWIKEEQVKKVNWPHESCQNYKIGDYAVYKTWFAKKYIKVVKIEFNLHWEYLYNWEYTYPSLRDPTQEELSLYFR